jgi:hypothetical protein
MLKISRCILYLTFTSEDRLGMDYVEEAKHERKMVPFLSGFIEERYQLEGKGSGQLSSVHLWGSWVALGFHGLLSGGCRCLLRLMVGRLSPNVI